MVIGFTGPKAGPAADFTSYNLCEDGTHTAMSC